MKGLKLARLAIASSALGMCAALLAFSGSSTVQAQTPPAVQSTLVATYELSGAPLDRHWVIRGEHPLNVEHSHAGGFVYAMKGSTTIQMEGGEVALQEGQ